MAMTLTQRTRRALTGLLTAASLGVPVFAQAAPSVQFQTSVGDFVIELDADKAPKTVENFLQYVKDKHYEGTIFHRVIDGFMVQGGGFTAAMAQKPTRGPIPLLPRGRFRYVRIAIRTL